ncbi:MAG: flagellar biosynthetic protein FliR [Clostridia bacterium]|jgi:flagellar biosynthetic protein FliR|nr:flagellar biosynthetic protein FliR [Clostridia bacterium]MCI1999871.1 flagellar biosynthetic protein FliR [Clostridia bacterium]MCI2014213.1 flagellar biosynthetic protein FliR [Clostridia bacterium]
MDLYKTDFVLFSFILMRMSGFIFLNPIFGRKNVPNIVKTGLVMALTIIVYTASGNEKVVISGIFEYGVLLVKEFAAGYAIGFVVSLFSYVIISAGEMIDMQMGMSMSKVFDAQTNSSISLSSTYYNILYMLLFFVADAHLALINILINSSKVMPYGQIALGQNLSKGILEIFTLCSVLAVKMAFPIIAIELLCAIGMGILMRAIPQVNVFVVDIQLKIFVGLFLIAFTFLPISNFLNNMITTMLESIKNIMSLMG